ncbi:hypothetical protein BDZ91DRAFT_709496 [Kalaharituber pfeilii]|nr:hypothetical protein BDZ91DRAFT_709496 [Kalaharituber pfeilii]
MRKLSDYFKSVTPSPSQPTTPAATTTPAEAAQKQLVSIAPLRVMDLNDGSSSPLSDCVSFPSPSPPPPPPHRAQFKPSVTPTTTVTTINRSKESQEIAKPAGRVIPDSEGEEDSDELEDVDTLLRAAITKSTKPEKPAKKQRKEPCTKPKPVPSLPTYTFSLDALIAQKEKDDAREEAIQRTEALIAGAEDISHMTNNYGPADKNLLDAAVGDEIGGKVLDMLNRREAWRVNYTWHFFEDVKQPRLRNPFPSAALKGWSSGLQDSAVRYQMFLSGYVQDMIGISPSLPDEVVSWILDELVLETRQDISFAYMRALEACHAQIPNILDCSKISHLFVLLGARQEAINTKESIALVASTDKGSVRRSTWNLMLLVRLLSNIAACLESAAAQTAFLLVSRLCLDNMFIRDGDLLIDIERSMYSLLMSVSSDVWDQTSFSLSETLLSTFTDFRAQIRLLKILPITSPRTHLFRRRLALAFLYSSKSYLTTPHDELVDMAALPTLLSGPQFTIRRDTDYQKLRSLIEILDIAVDDGSTKAFKASKHSKHVEAVCTMLKEISSKIRDSGMASLERTEAKQVMELTQFRLQYAVAKSRVGASVLEHHFLQDTLGSPADGKKQTLLRFEGESK